MLKFEKGFDPEKKEVFIIVSSRLIGEYYSDLEDAIKDRDLLPHKDAGYERVKPNSIKFTVPISPDQNISPMGNGYALVEIDLSKIGEALTNFINVAIKKDIEKTEFIPLTGYPIEDLQKEIISAVKSKRDLCILKTYNTYLKVVEVDPMAEVEQYRIKYGTDEYSDAVLYIVSGDFKKLKSLVKDKIKKQSWI